MNLSAEDWQQLWRHVAEEVNVNNIIVNRETVYSRAPLNERRKTQEASFSAIYDSNVAVTPDE